MRIDDAIVSAIKRQAKKERRSFNNLLENVLQDYVSTLKK